MFDLLLKNGTIITVDGQNRVISDGYVAVKDGIIAEIGEMESLDPAARAEKDVYKRQDKPHPMTCSDGVFLWEKTLFSLKFQHLHLLL